LATEPHNESLNLTSAQSVAVDWLGTWPLAG
jgi:hypothetical protein